MQFARFLREGIRAGTITCTIRIWASPRVKMGRRYRLGQGEIEVTSIQLISLAEITPELARQSGFNDVADLLKTAKHGAGEKIYYIEFRYYE